MLAIAEAALLGKLFHVGEGNTDTCVGIPEAQTAHAWHVDHVAAVGNSHHLAAHRGVAALAIPLANCADA